ncbi:MAG: M28 family peptidase, partial [Calditrichaeota bacterium]
QVHPFELNKKVEYRIDFENKTIEDRNVVGFLEGSDPGLKSQIIVFTAHYDHIGVGTPVNGDSTYNGAADNASGVSGLLELADAFSSLPNPPRRSLLFLAVTAEEKGLLGSEYYVEHPLFPLEQTVADFNLDMIGIGDTTGIVVYGIDRTTLGEEIRKAAARVGLKILPDEMPEQRIFYRSDHFNFAKHGIPVAFTGFGLRRAWFDEFEKFYHQPSDDRTLPFNYHYMKKHMQALFLAALAVADADEPPKWAPGDEFENARSDGKN